MASTFAGSRPSEKFGTHSISRFIANVSLASSPEHHRRFCASTATRPPQVLLTLSVARDVLPFYLGGLIKGLGGGYLLSPSGGIGRKSLLTRGSAGGVYFGEGSEASGFFTSFFGAASPLINRTRC